MSNKMGNKLMMVAVALLAVAVLVISGCGGPSEETTTSPTTAPTTAPTTTPTTAPTTGPVTEPTTTEPVAAKPEGTFVYGTASLFSESFIPWNASAEESVLYLPVYDNLVYPSTKAEFISGLAESWEYSDDFLTLTIHLREGIQWQDGWGEVTAEDVKFSIEQLQEKATLLGQIGNMNKIIDNIEAQDLYTVVIHQQIPNADLMTIFLAQYYSAILCKEYVETVGEEEANLHPIGSGPYKVIEHEWGNYIKYEALDEHWRVVPEFKYLTIRAIPEESTRIALLKTGDIDATGISPPSLAELPENSFTIHTSPFGINNFVILGGMIAPEDDRYIDGYHMQDPWADIRVREAMNISIDREAISNSLYAGTNTPIPIFTDVPGWRELGLDPIEYDPDRAIYLLDQAGYSDGFDFDMIIIPTVGGAPMLPKALEAVVGYWENIGLRPKISYMDFGALFPIMQTGETAGMVYGLKWDYDPDPTFPMSLYIPGGMHSFYQDPNLWPICQNIMGELGLVQRMPYYNEVAQYLRDNWIGISLWIQPQIFASNSEKIGEWPLTSAAFSRNLEYVRHATPLDTWRLFDLDQ